MNDRAVMGGLVAAALVVALVVGGLAWQRSSSPSDATLAKAKAKGKKAKGKKARTKGKKARTKGKGRPARAEPPNVLLIVWDTVRADHLSLYGYQHDTTPRLSRVGRRGTVFAHAVSPAIWTVPSHASLFTGLAPRTHGADFDWKWLDNRFVTMAEVLRDGGWETWAFSANPHVSADSNLLQGFDTVQHPFDATWRRQTRRHTRRKLVAEDKSTRISPKWTPSKYDKLNHRNYAKDGGPVARKAMLEWLDGRQSDKPWFAFLNYMEAHVPRVPAKKARLELFPKRRALAQLKMDQSYPVLLEYTVGARNLSAQELSLVSDTYDAALYELDRTTGLLLDELSEKGALKNTIVIVTSDHGEHLGEHHRIGHKYSVYEPLAHVPLVIWGPGVPKQRVRETVSTAGLLGTVAELTGVDLPEGVRAGSLLDADARGDLAVVEQAHPAPIALKIMKEHWPDIDVDALGVPRIAVATEGHKLVDNGGATELYDLRADPLESDDVAAWDPPRTARMREALKTWEAGTPTYDPADRGDDDVPPRLAPGQREQLAALGYVDGGEELGEDDDVEPE